MIKMRITFVDDKEGNVELKKALDKIDKDFDIIDKSKIYKGRNKSKFSNIYLDLKEK